ncbi:MAG: hypothetical protein WC511_02395 [Candidatus Pacearchaeota archaeon]
MEKEIEKHHPSYAVVRLSHRHGGGQSFFGSKIKCDSYIGLTISRAYEYRRLSENRYLNKEELIELRLTPNQFAELLTSMNAGVGVPATIEHINRERVEDPPVESEMDTYKREIEEQGVEAKEAVLELKQLLSEIKMTKADQARVKSAFCKVENEVFHNMPFVVSQAKECVDKAITEAKGAIDSFWTGIISRLGFQALSDKKNIVSLLENKTEEKE